MRHSFGRAMQERSSACSSATAGSSQLYRSERLRYSALGSGRVSRCAGFRSPYARSQDATKREMELLEARQEHMKLKLHVLSLRKKGVLYKLVVANADEKAELLQGALSISERVTRQLSEEREALLLCNKELQDQVQALIALCQGEHRAKVQHQVRPACSVSELPVPCIRLQRLRRGTLSVRATACPPCPVVLQGKVVCTDAEKKQLHSELQDSVQLSEFLTQQLAAERAALQASRIQAQELREQLEAQTLQQQQEASSITALRADCQKLQASLVEEQKGRSDLEAQIEKLKNGGLQMLNTELKLAAERLTRATQDSAQREKQLGEEFQRRHAADNALLQELRADLERLKERRDQDRWVTRCRSIRCRGSRVLR
jgi:hypothetical protein